MRLWAETESTPMNIALVGTLDAVELVKNRGDPEAPSRGIRGKALTGGRSVLDP